MNRRLIFFFYMCTILVLLNSCITYTSVVNIRLELPLIADGESIITYKGYTDIEYGDNTIIVTDSSKIAYTVSFDSNNRIPRWVAYDLTAEELSGTASRKGKNFRPDDNAGVKQADNYDYRNSGWTKGHLAPAGDFKWSDNAQNDTFYYTNCCPQTEYFNGTSWERLESRVRDWAKLFGKLYIVTGPIIGDAVNGYIGSNRIIIPDAFFKAILTKDGDTYQSIGFIMENTSNPQPYTSCCVSVDEIETITGLDLFCGLEKSIEESVESNFNTRFWGF